jgi:hypothetical protein
MFVHLTLIECPNVTALQQLQTDIAAVLGRPTSEIVFFGFTCNGDTGEINFYIPNEDGGVNGNVFTFSHSSAVIISYSFDRGRDAGSSGGSEWSGCSGCDCLGFSCWWYRLCLHAAVCLQRWLRTADSSSDEGGGGTPRWVIGLALLIVFLVLTAAGIVLFVLWKKGKLKFKKSGSGGKWKISIS